MKKLILLASLLLAACSTSKSVDTMAYNQALELAEQQWQANKDSADYKKYSSLWANFNNTNKLDERDGCYKYGRQPVKFILIYNEAGLVEKVVAQTQDEKTQCFTKSYLGVLFPKPPVSPFYQSMTMN